MDDYAKKQAVESEAQQLAARAAAERKSIPLNMDAALYRTADNLGDVKTDEMRFTVDGDAYITQGFVDGILYVKDGEWTNIHKIAWPAPAAAATSATSMGTSSASTASPASSSARNVGTPIGMSASGSAGSGGLESGTTSAPPSPAKPATPPAETHHEGGLGDVLGDVVSKVEDAMGRRHPETKE